MWRRDFELKREYPQPQASAQTSALGAARATEYVPKRGIGVQSQEHSRPSRNILQTPPLPPDLSQPAAASSSWLVRPGPVITPGKSSEPSFASHRFHGIDRSVFDTNLFTNIAEATADTRRSLIRGTMEILRESAPHLTASQAIDVIGDVCDKFLMNALSAPSFPLRGSDREEMQRLIAARLKQMDVRAIVPPTIPIMPKKEPRKDVVACFAEAQASFRTRIIRLLARYDPSRLPDVDAMIEHGKHVHGAEDLLLKKLVMEYGPEPQDAADALTLTVVLAEPVAHPNGNVSIYGTLRGTSSVVPRWSLAAGNLIHCTPIGLDSFIELGAASCSTIPLPSQSDVALCLELSPGAIRKDTQYTVWLSALDVTGMKAEDHKTFIAP